jgi:hypothetical protein
VIFLKRKKLQHALLLRLNNEIDAGVYKEVKAQYEEDICQLSLKEAELMNKMNRHKDYLEQYLVSIDDISGFYKKSNVKNRQAILALVLSDKLVYDNNKFQSGLFNSSVKLVCKPNKNG